MRWATRRAFLDVMGLTVNGLDRDMGLLARPKEMPVEPATKDAILAYLTMLHTWNQGTCTLWYCKEQ